VLVAVALPFAIALCCVLISSAFWLPGVPGPGSWRVPASPAFSAAAVARSALADGASALTSALVAGPLADGILRSGVRFLPLHAIYFGASNPDWSRLYELTSGLQTAVNPLA